MRVLIKPILSIDSGISSKKIIDIIIPVATANKAPNNLSVGFFKDTPINAPTIVPIRDTIAEKIPIINIVLFIISP